MLARDMVGNDSSFRKGSTTNHALKNTFIPWILKRNKESSRIILHDLLFFFYLERLLLSVTFYCFTFAVLSFTTFLQYWVDHHESIEFCFCLTLYLVLQRSQV